MKFFSASQLVKSSAKQILYLRDKPRPAPSKNTEYGDKFAAQYTKSDFVEMGGSLVYKDLKICFTVDEVVPSVRKIQLIEHKSVREQDLWYFRSAMIQTAFYGSLARYTEQLKTASFHEGEKHTIQMFPYQDMDKIYSFLNFGGTYYRVTSLSHKDIIRFFLTKARASLDWKKASRFDKEYHHQEWDKYFRKLIKYRKV